MTSTRLYRFVALGTFLIVSCVFLLARISPPVSSAAENSALQVEPLRVDRLDPALDRIVPAGAKIERIATGFGWVEGPVWADGSLFFADIRSNSIRRWTRAQGVSIFLQPSGYQGSAAFGGPESGFERDDAGCARTAHGRPVMRSAMSYRFESFNPHGQITILADSYQGKRLNSPNDVVYRSDGSLYFTDPPYGLRTQSDSDPAKQLKVNGVYRIPHALEQKPGAPPARGALQLLVSDLPRPNGIAFSPDEKYLYVDNSRAQEAVDALSREARWNSDRRQAAL